MKASLCVNGQLYEQDLPDNLMVGDTMLTDKFYYHIKRRNIVRPNMLMEAIMVYDAEIWETY